MAPNLLPTTAFVGRSLALIVVVTVAVAGCTSSATKSSAGTSSSNPTVQVSNMPTSAPPSVTTSSLPASSSPPAKSPSSKPAPNQSGPTHTGGAPECVTAAVNASAPQYIAHTSNLGFRITLTNVSKTLCRTEGWPGISFQSPSGGDIGDAARQGPSPSVVSLAPNSSTNIVFYLSNPAGGNGCKNAPSGSRFLLTPPNNTKSIELRLPQPRAICHPVVHPVGASS